MIVTTTDSLQGYRISEYLGIVSGEVVLGLFFVKDIFAAFRDTWGGRSKSYEKEINKGISQAISTMVERAERSGANAVIGLNIDIEVMSPRGKGTMVIVAASGTAVTLEPISKWE